MGPGTTEQVARSKARIQASIATNGHGQEGKKPSNLNEQSPSLGHHHEFDLILVFGSCRHKALPLVEP